MRSRFGSDYETDVVLITLDQCSGAPVGARRGSDLAPPVGPFAQQAISRPGVGVGAQAANQKRNLARSATLML